MDMASEESEEAQRKAQKKTFVQEPSLKEQGLCARARGWVDDGLCWVHEHTHMHTHALTHARAHTHSPFWIPMQMIWIFATINLSQSRDGDKQPSSPRPEWTKGEPPKP
jgi:hypothetical protein